MLRETLKPFARYKAKSSGLLPHLVPTLACEHPYSHSWPNRPFSAQLCDGFDRDESKGKLGSHGRAEEETPEDICRAETKSLCRPSSAQLTPR